MRLDVQICPCQSGNSYSDCCELYHISTTYPKTPEQLMRSRYSAYIMGLGDYLWQTHHEDFRGGIDKRQLNQPQTQWQKLTIIFSSLLPDGEHGIVEFKAWYRDGERLELLHERSNFINQHGQWLYTDGEFKPKPIGRNMLCPCLSQKKFKHCCGRN